MNRRSAGAAAPRRATRLSAGVVVVRRDADCWRCLILRCYRNWDFPKGVVEANEQPLEAALRELAEETNLNRVAMRWGETYRETEPYAGGKVARCYVAEYLDGDVSLPFNAGLGRPEHHEFRWVDFDEADRLLPPRLKPILDWARRRVESEA